MKIVVEASPMPAVLFASLNVPTIIILIMKETFAKKLANMQGNAIPQKFLSSEQNYSRFYGLIAS